MGSLETLKEKCYAHLKESWGEDATIVSQGGSVEMLVKAKLDALLSAMDEKQAAAFLSIDGLTTEYQVETQAGETYIQEGPVDVAELIINLAIMQGTGQSISALISENRRGNKDKFSAAAEAFAGAVNRGQLKISPNSVSVESLMRLFNNPQRLQSTRAIKVTKQQKFDDENTWIITYEGKDEKAILTIQDFQNAFSKQVKNGGKIFKFALQRANEQGTIRPVFTLQDLVDLRIYSNQENAYRGITNVIRKMEHINIEVEWKGRGAQNKGNRGGALIGFKDINFRQCYVTLHEDICNAVPSYYSVFPQWGYALPESAFNLLDYLYSMARKRTAQLKADGYFDVKLDTIRIAMGLPSPEDAKGRHTQLIKEPIEKAITAIEDEQLSMKANSIKMTPYYDDMAGIATYLQGFLRVQLEGDALDYMIAIESRRHRKAVSAEKKAKKGGRKKTENS